MEMTRRVLTRRSALLLAGSAIAPWGRLYASTTGDFWNKKDPSQWDPEQIDKLLHKSPWAREVTAQLAPGERPSGYPGGGGGGYPGGGGGGYPGGGGGGYPRGGLGIPGMGYPRGGMGGGRRGGPTRQADAYEKGTVRWESAQPILAAQKKPLPEAFANHYVISVSGIPLRTSRRRDSQTDDSRDDSRQTQTQNSQDDDALDNLKQLTILRPKGKDLIQAGVVQRATGGSDYATFLFGFSKESLQFNKADKEVEFETKIGQYLVKTKFDLKAMQYHKQLAV